MEIGTRPRPVVAVVGSVNVDLVVAVDRHVTPGETILASGYAETTGGKGFNQAVAAARYAEAHLIGAVGNDSLGARALARAGERGVRIDGVARTGHPTGRAFIAVSPDGENSIVVAPLANHTLAPGHVTAALDRARPVAVLTQLEIPLDAVAAAAAWCEANGARFLLNPSPVADVPAGVVGLADPLIVNEREAEGMLRRWCPGDHVDAADHAAAGASLARVTRSVVITAGPRGATFASASRRGHVPARAVDAVDTTGAGDEFAGTLLAVLATGAPVDHAVEQAGNAASDLVVTARSDR